MHGMKPIDNMWGNVWQQWPALPLFVCLGISLRDIYIQLTHLELLKMVKIIERAQAEERRKTRLDSPHPAGKTAVDVCECVCVVLVWNIFSRVYSQPHHFSLEGRTWTHKQERKESDTYIYIPTGLSGDQC